MSDISNDSTRKALNALANTRFTTYWLDSLDPVSDEPALQLDSGQGAEPATRGRADRSQKCR
jgi:hypothetical protein